MTVTSKLHRQKIEICPFHGNGRVYVVSEAAALRQILRFLPVLLRDTDK